MDLTTLIKGLQERDLRSLSRAITLLESTTPQDRMYAKEIMGRLLPSKRRALRVGITGSPGVGKSTLIEALGLELVRRGKRLAVLSVDPTSPLSGGSVLADKTRMTRLSREPNAYIRPSPSGSGHSIHPTTHEVITLLEAVGFDMILVETVGVGQSEVTVSHCTDMVMVLLHPGAGDEYQGIKRGLLELSDLVVITKADGDLKDTATRTLADYRGALGLLPSPHGFWPRVLMTCSALGPQGLGDVADQLDAFFQKALPTLSSERAQKAQALFYEALVTAFRTHLETTWGSSVRDLESRIADQTLTPRQACDAFFTHLVSGDWL